MMDALEIAKRFDLDGEPVDAKPYGCGHINDTYCVYCHREEKNQRRYILQRVNSNVFKNVPELMDNMIRVTAFLRDRVMEAGGDPDRECLQLVPHKTGALYFQDEEGGYWRCFIFIENAVTFQTVEKPETAPTSVSNVIPISAESKQPGDSKAADDEPIEFNSPRENLYSLKVTLGGDRLRRYFPDVTMPALAITESIYSALEERRQREARMKQKTEILHPSKPIPTR